MPTYLARLTVHGDLEPDQLEGMADALGAARSEPDAGHVVLWVPGEAPDLPSAQTAARRHAAEVLEGWIVDVEVVDSPEG